MFSNFKIFSAKEFIYSVIFVAMFMTGMTERETSFGKKNLKNQEFEVLVQDSVQCKNIHYFPNLTSCFTRGLNTCRTG